MQYFQLQMFLYNVFWLPPPITHCTLKPFGSHLKATLKLGFAGGVHKYKKCLCFYEIAVDAVQLTLQLLMALPLGIPQSMVS